MLYEFLKQEKISRYQLMMTNLANQLPAYFLHLPTTVFIVLPLTGIAGAIYFLLTFLAAVPAFAGGPFVGALAARGFRAGGRQHRTATCAGKPLGRGGRHPAKTARPADVGGHLCDTHLYRRFFC